MKKIVAMVMSLVIVGSMLTACSSKNNDSSSSSSETTTTTSESTVKLSLEEIGSKIEAAAEWPVLQMVTDAERLKDYYTIDNNNPNYEEVIVKGPTMSAAFGEYIVIKAKPGKVDEAVKDLEARKTKLVEQDAFYPEHKDLAQQAIVGKQGDYAYLIAHEKAADVEKALKDALK